MAYTLVQTITVGSGGAASIEFTNIPQTGKDLLMIVSSRSAQTSTDFGRVELRLNNTTANYTTRWLEGTGSGVSSSSTQEYFGWTTATNATANTFSSTQAYVSNYTSAVAKSVSVDGVTENNATLSYQAIGATSWNNTSAVTSLLIRLPGSFNFVQNSTASLYIIDTVDAAGATGGAVVPKASGGTITLSGGYWYHTFTSTGTFTPSQNLTCDFAIVAGGGAGGGGANNNVGGGGGAGGVITSYTGLGVTPVSSMSAMASTNYTITVGNGGSNQPEGAVGGSGGNSTAFGHTAIGGGGGAFSGNGLSGGSGGGASGLSAASGGSGTTDQGNSGGGSINGGFAGGGGGRASSGSAGTFSSGGAGGNGITLPFTGSVAGGGGGGGQPSNPYGTFVPNGANGTGSDSFGGGGAGGRRTSGSQSGGVGRAGVVVIRYPA